MKKICLLICSVLVVLNLSAQESNDQVLLTINDQKITKEEFQRIYNKNKKNLSTGEITSVEDYLDLFINFKLKVYEAEKMGLDTTESFLNEFQGYKEQLATPYLLDEEANQRIIEEAYDRMQYEVRASHILVKLSPDALPEDTLEAYEKAMDIRRRIIRGEPFESVAKGSSDDPSVKNNGGDLGYFTVFQMIYPFENAAYNLEIGEISKPVRTRFGYHIVKVVDKREACGQVKVAHIMLTVPRGTIADEANKKKQLINELYHRAKQGDDFASLAREYSDDKGSARKGGELPWFGTGRMVKEFEKAAFELESDGEISKPVRTSFGWHIIKRIDRKEIPEFKDAVADIKHKVGRDQRAQVARKSLIEKLKKEYNFTEFEENIPVNYDTIDQVYVLKQKYITPGADLSNVLFSFLEDEYKENDFVDFVESKKGTKELTPYDYKRAYNDFVETSILETEKSRLTDKYPEYKYLLKEYYEGMLLFEITDKEVWTKAVNDSVGLLNYYNDNKDQYMWDERWEGSLYFCANEKVYDKVSKIISKRKFGRKVTNNDLLKQFNEKDEVLRIETGIYEKGENKVVDRLIWNKGPKVIKHVAFKGKVIKPKVKKIEDCKGLVISDYQDYLDKQWIKRLKEQYNIKVNKSVLSTVK
jgi:peptidyl-prolyl cis-trans isomerase SurA